MDLDGSDGSTAGGLAAASPTNPGRDRIGARLAAARVAAGIDLADIARDTRVPLRHLRAIENDTHDELPALPYSIGFVKSFARIVGVDPDEAATRFRAETSKTAHVPMMTPIEPLDERRLPPRGLVAGSVFALVLLLGGLTAYGAGWFDGAPAEAPATVAAAEPEPQTVAPADIPDTPMPGAPAATVAVPTGGGVTIAAKDDAWFRVYRINVASGKRETVREGVLAKGERYDVPPGEAGLKLWTGRAGALQVSVGGRVLPPLGGPVDTVRNFSLEPAALVALLAPAPTVAAPTPAAVAPGVR